ncbi:serine protease gd-like [Trichogramma pretiosum]|uniref:serine protease gd-like n=1 Tax=Trichogramma pretiosum TaxID=7493 RepID=UPI0006C97012|nr:serine protease gd-like [Trichogramma pretiosum]
MYRAAGTLCLIICVLQLLFSLGQSQCPEYFRYYRNETNGEISGLVEIPSPPQGVPLHLSVILSIATVLPTKYMGKLELAKSKDESVRDVLQGKSLYYRVHFPVTRPFPTVLSISLNDILFCRGEPAYGVVVTNIILEHTLYPPRVIIPTAEQLLSFLSDQTTTAAYDDVLPINLIPSFDTTTEKRRPPSTTEAPTTTTTTTNLAIYTEPATSRPISSDDSSSCGVVSSSYGASVSNKRENWPWLVAIFTKKESLEFQCTGNLISRTHVITAAHCLQEDVDVPIRAEQLIVALGIHNIRNEQEPGQIRVGVRSYDFHPDYKNPDSADSDLAIVKLAERVEFSAQIRPICLWMSRTDLKDVVGKSGYVVGWSLGGNNGRYNPEPRASRVPIVSQEECLRSNVNFADIVSERTFCAGRRDGKGPCDGDSGSGLVMFHPRHARYHLRGIVSIMMLDIRTRSCDLQEYVIYVDVAKYLPWIRQQIYY